MNFTGSQQNLLEPTAQRFAARHACTSDHASLTALSGVVLLVSAVLYFGVVAHTLWGREHNLETAPEIPFSEILSKAKPSGFQKWIDDLGLLFWIAAILALAVYLPTLIEMWNHPNLVRGWQLW